MNPAFLIDIGNLFDDIIDLVNTSEPSASVVGEKMRKMLYVLKQTSNEIQNIEKSKYLALDIRITLLINTWHDEIQKDYTAYIMKNFS